MTAAYSNLGVVNSPEIGQFWIWKFLSVHSSPQTQAVPGKTDVYTELLGSAYTSYVARWAKTRHQSESACSPLLSQQYIFFLLDKRTKAMFSAFNLSCHQWKEWDHCFDLKLVLNLCFYLLLYPWPRPITEDHSGQCEWKLTTDSTTQVSLAHEC